MKLFSLASALYFHPLNYDLSSRSKSQRPCNFHRLQAIVRLAEHELPWEHLLESKLAFHPTSAQ